MMGVFIIVVIVAAIVILLIVAATKPATFELERTAFIDAPPAKVFGLIDDFHQWALWSPWERMDAEGQLKKTFSGPDRGAGAHYAWDGPKTGQGQMDLTDAVENRLVAIRLEFTKPFKAVNTTRFDLEPEGKGTRVRWAMSGPQPFMNRLMTIFFSMDKMVGGQFEQGLARMKEVAEG